MAIKFTPGYPFKSFGEKICNSRRLGAVHSKYTIRANTDKLIGNFYGKCGEDLRKHKKAVYCSEFEKDLMALKNDFVEAKPFDASFFGGTFCVERRKRRIVWDRAVQVATAVYGHAKLNYLKFVFEVLAKIPKYPDGGRKIQLLYGDTDSVWIACTEEELTFKNNKYFPSESQEIVAKIEGREITKAQYERYTPLLWKIEYTGHVFIGPKSKSYYADGPGGRKMSCKGAMKHIVEENKTLKNDFLDMIFIDKKRDCNVVNRGFKFSDGHMFSYEQQRSFLTYWYDHFPP